MIMGLAAGAAAAAAVTEEGVKQSPTAEISMMARCLDGILILPEVFGSTL
jgi:hypothetical protein